MVDPSFVSQVVALLVGRHTGWHRTPELIDVIATRFADDPAAMEALVACSDASPGIVADTVRRHAEADPAFLSELRQLVIAAYGDPTVAADLPDPSPRM